MSYGSDELLISSPLHPVLPQKLWDNPRLLSSLTYAASGPSEPSFLSPLGPLSHVGLYKHVKEGGRILILEQAQTFFKADGPLIGRDHPV